MLRGTQRPKRSTFPAEHTYQLQLGLGKVGGERQVSIVKIHCEVVRLAMQPIHFAHFGQPVQQHGPHPGLEARVLREHVGAPLPQEVLVLAAHLRPHALLVCPRQVGQRARALGQGRHRRQRPEPVSTPSARQCLQNHYNL